MALGGVVATQLTVPDTVRTYTVTVGPHDVTPDVQWDSLVFEDQGSGVQGTAGFRINQALSAYPGINDQSLVEIVDHVAGGKAFRGFVDSRNPARLPSWSQIAIAASDHTSLLDNVIPLETRPAGESDEARIGVLWGEYAGPYLSGDLTFVQQVSASLPGQLFAGVTLRQAIDLIAAQAGSSVVWYLDSGGRLHYFSSETNDAPKNVTSDTPGAGEIAPQDLAIDYDSKSYISAVFVRGKTAAGSGWVYSGAAQSTHGDLRRTKFLDAPDCSTAAMRDALGRMYLGRVGSAIPRGTFSTTSAKADGWRAGQNVTVRSSHLGGINQSLRLARVRTSVLGPLAGRPAALRRYEVEFGGARAGSSNPADTPVVGTGLVGDILDDSGNLLLGSAVAGTSGFGPALRRYIMSGVYNGDFALTPPAADSDINGLNTLPFWTSNVVSGDAIKIHSVADPTSASGRLLQFDMAAGAAGDEAYIEQIIPVNGSRGQSYGYFLRPGILVPASTSAVVAYVSGQYLKNDGVTTTGASFENSAALNLLSGTTYEFETNAFGGNAPADAYYLRMRIGIRRGAAAASQTQTVQFTEARIEVGTPSRYLVQNNPDGSGIYGRWQFYSAGLIAFEQLGGGGAGGTATLRINANILSLVGNLATANSTVQANSMAFSGSSVNITAAGNQITPIHEGVEIALLNNTAGSITLTSTPTIPAGVGQQLLLLINLGAQNVVIQDNGTLAGSTLRLSTATYTIGPRDNILLLYVSGLPGWVEIARTNVI